MVLDVEGKRISKKVLRYTDFIKQHRDTIEESAKAFHAMTELNIAKDTPRTLYLHQREFAVVNLEDEFIPTIIGSDEATTCHLVVLMSRQKRILSFGHIDGSGISGFISSSTRSMKDLGDNLSNGVDVFIVGGFLDDSGGSQNISLTLLNTLTLSNVLFFLRTAAICEFNSYLRPDLNLHFPRCYGIAINTEKSRTSPDLHIVPAVFKEFGPCQELRSTRFCSYSDEMYNVFNPLRNEIKLAPFDYYPISNLQSLVNAPDHVLRAYSTSPRQEKDGYEARMRNTLRFMLQHPKPKEIFKAGPLRFRMNSDSGLWETVE